MDIKEDYYMSVQTFTYCTSKWFTPFHNLSRKLSEGTWEESENKLGMILVTKSASEFLAKTLTNTDEDERNYLVTGQPNWYRLAFRSLKKLGKIDGSEYGERNAAHSLLRSYLAKLQKLRMHMTKCCGHSLTEEEFRELADFFATVGGMDEDIAQENRNAQRHQSGCF
jgi:hypothetical protein